MSPRPSASAWRRAFTRCAALLGGRLLDGVASYGKPMFNNQRPPFETHFFDFDEDIYGRHLGIALIAHIRGQKMFSGLDELIAAIDRDSRRARGAGRAPADRRARPAAGVFRLGQGQRRRPS